MNEIILASCSPRRKELMELMGLEFSVMPAGVEEPPCGAMSPREYVMLLSQIKAQFIANTHPEARVVGADTVVVLDNRILGKPASRQEAFSMLRALSGRTHTVYTGVTVVHNSAMLTDCCSTDVTFSSLSDKEINDYIDTGDPFDKAGAYGIQGAFCSYIESINGSYFNVMGLPVHMLKRLFSDLAKMSD